MNDLNDFKSHGEYPVNCFTYLSHNENYFTCSVYSTYMPVLPLFQFVVSD
jgi:hypothetical protein